MERNPYMCLAIVVSLSSVSLVATAGIILCAATGHEVPQTLTALASSAVGAIAGSLAVAPHVYPRRNSSGQAPVARDAEMPTRP